MEHPYLFFSKEDISALRKRFEKEPFLTRWKLMVEDADKILTQGSAPSDTDRMSYRTAATTAFVYAITGEKKYARRAIDEVLLNLDLDVKQYWQFNSVNCHGAGLGTSNYSISCGLVYDWCYDAMSEQERIKFKDGFENIANDLYLKSLHHTDNPENSDWWVYRDHSNWSGVCHGAQGVAALAFYYESDKARRAARYASVHIHRFVRNNLDKDGGAAEGVMYARYGIEFAIMYLTASCRFFGLNETMRETLKVFNDRLAGYWDIYMLAPDNNYANFGNIGEETMTAFWTPEHREAEGPYASLHAFFDAILPDGDPLLRWASDVGGSWYIWRGASPFYLLWRKDEEPPCVPLNTPPPMKLQDAVLFRETGHAVFRTERLWLAFNGGLVSPDSHFNRDLGSFILFFDNERFTCDPGYGDSETWQHSTLLVNGLGQIKDGRGKFLCFDKGDDFFYLSCELADSYDPKADLIKFIRHIAVIKGKYVLMLDEAEAGSPSEFEWLLQTRKELSTDNTKATLSEGDKKMHIVQAKTEQTVGLTVSHWKKTRSEKNSDVTTLHIKPFVPSETHTFVTVFYPSDSGVSAPVITFDSNSGEIKVYGGDGETDTVIFQNENFNLRLKTVNGNKLSGLLNPEKRSVKPFRDTSRHEVDETKMPPWLLSSRPSSKF